MVLFCNIISQLKNAVKSNKKFVLIPKSAFCLSFLKLLFFEGFISSVIELESGKLLKVYLKYQSDGSPCFFDIKFLSTPSRTLYLSYSQITNVSHGVGVLIISTPKGLYTNQACLKLKLGGTALCYIT
jgi:small subunit ribosomal protein S8